MLAKTAMIGDTEGFVLFVSNTLGWSREEVEVYIAHVRKELKGEQHHYYAKHKVVWAQKPEA